MFAWIKSFGKNLTLLAGLSLLVLRPLPAQDAKELAKNNPVAIVALTSGGCELKRLEDDWQTVRWLTLLYPEDQLRCNNGAKIVVNFFADQHRESLASAGECKVSFRNLSPTGSAKISKDQAQDRAVSEVPIPYMMQRKLFKKDFEQADEPEAMAKEEVFIQSAVRPEAFPPVFQWKNVGTASYKLQLFNESNEVIWENKTKECKLRYPFNAPFNLAKNSQYYWQVLSANDTIVVRKYPFTLLTLPHSQELERKERRFDQLVSSKKATSADYTDMFLLYNHRRLIDRSLNLLRQMAKMEPDNPSIQRALVRGYLDKGCPAHARECLEKEIRLNGEDPVRE